MSCTRVPTYTLHHNALWSSTAHTTMGITNASQMPLMIFGALTRSRQLYFSFPFYLSSFSKFTEQSSSIYKLYMLQLLALVE